MWIKCGDTDEVPLRNIDFNTLVADLKEKILLLNAFRALDNAKVGDMTLYAGGRKLLPKNTLVGEQINDTDSIEVKLLDQTPTGKFTTRPFPLCLDFKSCDMILPVL